jgi:spore coat protein H
VKFKTPLRVTFGLAGFALMLLPDTLPAAAGDDLFSPPRTVRLRIEISETNAEALREQPRNYVEAMVREDGGKPMPASVKLKGRTGSFRPLEGKPALTLDFTRPDLNGRFHGLQKIHLNNSVEDPTFLCEYLGGAAFARAGIPAARTAWALVELNGRPLGFYVLKEGFTPEFLEANFRSAAGNLYEATPANDIDGRLIRDSGSGPDTQEDLRKLAAEVLAPASTDKWSRLGQMLDTDRFVSFMALEVMVGHRDGYSLARNNYRLYHNPADGRFVFLPHGMDILFGRPDATWRPTVSGVAAVAVLDTPEGRRLYRERFDALVEQALDLSRITNQVDVALQAWRAVLPAADHARAAREAAGLQQRIAQRKAYLLRQLKQPEIPLLSFREGSVVLTNEWRAMDATEGVTLDRISSPDGRAALHVKAGPRTSASWRIRVRVPAGVYRFEAGTMTRGVTPLPFGRNHGAAIRANGLSSKTPPGLKGDSAWQTITTEFTTTASEQETELVCELRASGGEAWFDAASLKLSRSSAPAVMKNHEAIPERIAP